MRHNFCGRLMLAIIISASFAACNSGGKSSDKGTANDSTKMTQTGGDNTAGKDAVSVAPNLYKLVADTMGIRVVEVMYKPGDSSALHWHPDYAIYAIDGGTATFYDKDGKSMVNEMKQGMAMVRPGEWHSVKNTGKTDMHVLLVEVNRKGAITAPDPATDATKVSGDLYKTLADTMGIRIVAAQYKPGQESKMHWHPDNAIYAVNDCSGEFTSKDGKKNTVNFKKGMMMIRPAESHSVKNTGTTPINVILVEVYRAM
jgi:oxalate decarboxylase/phosphoglucose isomerase-like protein (cupin superfamily)